MNKAKKNLLEKTYQRFMMVGLSKSNPNNLKDIVQEAVMGFGTTFDEKIFSLAEAEELMKRQNEQSKGISMKWDSKPLHRHISDDGNTAIYADDLFVKVTLATGDFEMYLRFSIVFEYINQKWMIVHWHGSKPEEVESEKDTFGIDTWKEKAEALEKTVAERTADLVVKNRELEIEAALERVRAKSLAMHTTSALQGVIHTVHQELLNLNIGINGGSFIAINSDIDKELHCWGSGGTADTSEEVHIPYFNKPFYTNLVKRIKKAPSFFTEEYSQKEKKEFFTFLFKHEPWSKLKAKQKKETLSSPGGYTRSCSVSKHSSIFIINHFGVKFSAAENEILKRFGKVFEQTYVRFMDLQKAEAQAREANIEAALERVRARSMAMHQSEELLDVANVLFQQLRSLGGKLWASGVVICKPDTTDDEVWFANEKGVLPAIDVPHTKDPTHKKMYEGWNNKLELLSITKEGKELKAHYDYMLSVPTVQPLFEKILASGLTFPEKQTWYAAYFSFGYILAITLEPYEKEQVFVRFAKVFNQAYTRFLDLQKAEAQAREAQIEAALEKVRSRSMAMHKSEELADLSLELVKQVQALGVATWFCAFNINDEDGSGSMEWGSNGLGTFPKYKTPREGVFLRYYKAGKKGETLLVNAIGEDKCPAHYEYLCSLPGVGEQLLKMKADGIPFPASQIDHVAFFKYGYVLFITYEPVPESHEIFKRFAKIFEQTYTRFLDLQKAEAQVREANIEAALERVRSRSMAMHSSSELVETSDVMQAELKKLNIQALRIGICTIDKETESAEIWSRSEINGKVEKTILGVVPKGVHPIFDDMVKAWKEKQPSFSSTRTGEEVKKYYVALSPYLSYPLPESFNDQEAVSAFFFPEGSINVVSNDPLQKDDAQIMLRFAKEFGQVYRRFQDLLKAEAQAIEAQIQLSLERIRSRAMAMHNSDVLPEVGALLYQELSKLGIENLVTGYTLMEDEGKVGWNYGVNPFDGKIAPLGVGTPHNETVVLKNIAASWRKQEPLLITQLDPEETIAHQTYMAENCSNFPISKEKHLSISPEKLVVHTFNFSQGYLLIVGGTLLNNEQQEMVTRFAKVFEMTYRRFLDLKHAEAQAREAQIEAALERVRSRTMGMQQSAELGDVATELFNQMSQLVANLWTCGFVLCEKDRNEDEWWLSMDTGFTRGFMLPNVGDYAHATLYEGWMKGEAFRAVQLAGEDLQQHYKWLMNLPVAKSIFEEMDDAGLERPDWQKLHAAYFSKGYLVLITGEPCGEEEIFKRFAQVFDQTYTRFLDLKKAEAQAREAQIENALEKVRSRTMAMQHSDELNDTANVMFQQVQALGSNTWNCGFYIWEDNKKLVRAWNATKGTITNSFVANNSEDAFLRFYEASESGESLYVEEIGGDKCAAHYRYMRSLPVVGEIIKDLEANGVTLPTYQIFHIAYFPHGYLLFITYEPVPEMWEVFKRFGKVFEQTYTRFLDLKKAEAQARESEIELALERVRARTMAMQNSDELREAVLVINEQLQQLNFESKACNIIIIDKDTGDTQYWVSGFTKDIYPVSYHVPYFDHPYYDALLKPWKQGDKYEVYEYEDDGKKKFDKIWFTRTDFKNVPEEAKQAMMGLPSVTLSTAFFSNGALQLIGPEALSDEKAIILQRFAKVFNQTYTRFLDLQKAEAQAREAQIEAALEKVRSRSLAMQKTEELQEVVAVVAEKLHELGVIFDAGGVILCTYFPDNKDVVHWIVTPDFSSSGRYLLPYFDNPIFSQAWDSKIRGDAYFSKEFPVAAKNHFFEQAFEHSDYKHMPQDYKDFVLNADQHRLSAAWSKNSAILIPSLTGAVPSEDDAEIMKRFAKVFEQAYIRFMDLQKAEVQAIESKIQLALERVRASAMAMHNSDDLASTIRVFYEEFVGLSHTPIIRCGAGVFREKTSVVDLSSISLSPEKELVEVRGTINMSGHPLLAGVYKNWLQQKEYSHVLRGKEINDYYNYLKSQVAIPEYPDDTCQYSLFPMFPEGSLYVFTEEPLLNEDKKIFRRFNSVLSLTYRRYNDLQNSEAQAREAKIELSLERIRAQALAMRESADLLDIVVTMRTEFVALGHEAHYFWHMRWQLEKYEKAMTSGDGTRIGMVMELPRHIHGEIPLLANWEKSNAPTVIYAMDAEEAVNYVEKMVTLGDFKQVDHNAPTMDDIRHIGGLTFIMARTTHGEIGFSLPGKQPDVPKDAIDSLVRFAGAFDLAYKRFEDLMSTEQRNQEAQVELGLERVRARTMAMHKSDELAETSAILFQQLILLGIEPNRLYITIIDEEKDEANFWITDEDGSKTIDAYSANLNDNSTFKKMYDGWKQKLKHQVLDMEGDELQNYFKYLQSRNVHFKDVLDQKRRVQHLAYFSKGFIGVASPDEQPIETLQLLERFAAVFNLTFTRFNDLKLAEAHAFQAAEDLIKLQTEKQRAEAALTNLKAAQSQLVQSEKMASLGELTAGIAHEIQNPLNFVNNFSEVSNELLDEMLAEAANGNYDEVKEILKDVKQNLEKINHHGKRADGIVKGMLQHSRSSTGKKEPTDINALADEYLRLAYHGLRAKDKSFNATMDTDFDESLEKVNVIPQDIGRVILNLITNAFYVVNEKKKLSAGSYQPTVWVSTKKINDTIEIKVADNGNGIQQNVIDKIFQPFFTTKPTGQGTGLGLSLAFDIVKSHGGMLEVKTEEGEGAAFIIQLPTITHE